MLFHLLTSLISSLPILSPIPLLISLNLSMASSHPFASKFCVMCSNKSVLNWSYFCQFLLNPIVQKMQTLVTKSAITSLTFSLSQSNQWLELNPYPLDNEAKGSTIELHLLD
jgi:hypothetical protein